MTKNMKISDYIYDDQLGPPVIKHDTRVERFYSDRSAIVFASSFRRMIQKAQVFSLESNSSVRNRLTHSLEVADIGKTIARRIGKILESKGMAEKEDTECMQSIVENACLIHDIGNPPFGHFGEEAIKNWFKKNATSIIGTNKQEFPFDDILFDFQHFDGNPQGFRIVTQLLSEIDQPGLNLTFSTLLASLKYPNSGKIDKEQPFQKKIGIFKSEHDLYKEICQKCGHSIGKRYFLVYIMELADDISYCLSDIADGFEKNVMSSREFKEEFKRECREYNIKYSDIIPSEVITNFGFQVSMNVAKKVIAESCDYYVNNIEQYIAGDAKEISSDIENGKLLEAFKHFARRNIYNHQEIQRIEIAGGRIVDGLLTHYGRLLEIPKDDFQYFVNKKSLKKDSNLDAEWRVFNQLSKRMLKVYSKDSLNKPDKNEWVNRAHFIVDYVSGLTDHYALESYQNFMGISF